MSNEEDKLVVFFIGGKLREVFASDMLISKSETLFNGLSLLSQGKKFKNICDNISGYSFLIEDEAAFAQFLENSKIRFIMDNNLVQPIDNFNKQFESGLLDGHKKELEHAAQIMKNKLSKQKNQPLKIETASDLDFIRVMNVHDRRIRADKLLDKLYSTNEIDTIDLNGCLKIKTITLQPITKKDFIKRQLHELRS